MATAPDVIWSKLILGAALSSPEGVSSDANDSIYVVGYVYTNWGLTSDGIFDGQTVSGEGDGFITRYNSDGTKLWTKLVSGDGYEFARKVTASANGSIYVVGETTSSALDGQASPTLIDGVYGYGIHNTGYVGFITCYDSNGNKAWTRLFGGTTDYAVSSVTTASDGSIYVAGYAPSSLSGRFEGFVYRFNTDGIVAWHDVISAGSSSNSVARAVITGSDGAIYVVGNTSGSTLDGQTSAGNEDGFIVRYGSDGTKEWTRLLSGRGSDYAASVATSGDGAVYVVGTTNSGRFYDQTTVGLDDAFITRFNSDGTRAWTRLIGGAKYENAFGVTVGANGNIYVVGATSSHTFEGQPTEGGYDGFVTCFSSDGSKLWTRLVGGVGNDYPRGFTASADGSIYVAGESVTVTYDGQIADVAISGFLTKLSHLNSLPTGAVTITGTATVNQTITVSSTLADADGMGTISYQWLADGVNISGATSNSLTIANAQVGKAISVKASYVDLMGTTESLTSSPVVAVNYNTTAAENSKTITTLAVTDALLGTAPKFTLSGLDASLFKVSSKGVLTFAAVKDYEQPVDANKDGIYEVSVTLTNAKTGYRVVQDLTVGVEFVPINGTTGSDTLKGTAGWDTLDGLAGDDKLTGGTGLDTFLVTSGHDTILDFNALTKGATGSEVLQVSAGATADATLKAAWVATADSFNDGTTNLTTKGMAVDLSGITHGHGWNVTNAGAATIINGSQFNDVLTGGTGNDQLLGGAGNDVLAGGKGADTLTGGSGADSFRLSGDTKSDHITDFFSGTDRIELDNLLYKALGTGPLAANQFAQGGAATTTTQRIVYDQPTGNLWYDADGSGKGKAVLIGVLDNHVQIAHTDFYLI